MKIKIQKPRGTKDILPDDQKYWQYISDIVDKRCRSFNFGKIETPILEFKDLYTRGIGEATDIIEKEMFEVSRGDNNIDLSKDDDKESLVLRPEYTAGIVRSFIENGMQTWTQPVKLYSFGPVFRYDRPQKGRYRQFWQFNIEVLGDANPLTDALLILLVWQIFSDIGLKKDSVIDINSIGCRTCRPRIRKKIIEYYKKYKDSLCFNCQRRLELNPLRLFDCKEEKCQKFINGAPQIVDNLCTECKKSFTQVLEYLDELNIPYDLNPKLVRGLDYYTKTTFEIRDINDTSRQSSFGGGGRYDNLIETYGGKNTPAVGFAAGVERIIDKVKESEINVPSLKGSEVFIIQIGDKAKKKALSIISSLGEIGITVSCSFGKESLKAQLKDANRMKARIALIIGQREALDSTVIIKDMNEASQETIDISDLNKVIIKKLRTE
jgi:histidyl-tRNA synthetase